MSITSDEVNFLVYRYLQESGLSHLCFIDSNRTQFTPCRNDIYIKIKNYANTLVRSCEREHQRLIVKSIFRPLSSIPDPTGAHHIIIQPENCLLPGNKTFSSVFAASCKSTHVKYSFTCLGGDETQEVSGGTSTPFWWHCDKLRRGIGDVRCPLGNHKGLICRSVSANTHSEKWSNRKKYRRFFSLTDTRVTVGELWRVQALLCRHVTFQFFIMTPCFLE